MGSVVLLKDVRRKSERHAYLADDVQGDAVDVAGIWKEDYREQFAERWVGSLDAIDRAFPFFGFLDPATSTSFCDFAEARVGELGTPIGAVSGWPIAARDSPPES
jgi:hypothetical protein